jgi:hypothetical protein
MVQSSDAVTAMIYSMKEWEQKKEEVNAHCSRKTGDLKFSTIVEIW